MDSGLDGVNARNLSVGSTANDDQKVKTSSVSLAAPTVQDSNIARLPRELLDQVTSFLPTRDFNNLRLTCKLVENKIFPYWSNTFFKKRQFMITPFSLQTLVDISRHPTLGPCLTHLIIGLDYVKATPAFYCARPEDYGQCKLTADIQDSLLDTGLAVQLFSTAFLNLRNLVNVAVRDFNSYTRYRDAISHPKSSRARFNDEIPAWKSYGHSRLKPWSQHLDDEARNCGLCGLPSYAQSFVDGVFKSLVTALGRSGGHVRGLEILSRHRHIALSDSAFVASTLLNMTDTKLPLALAGLNKLHLDLDVTRQSLPVTYGRHSSSVFEMPGSVQEIYDPATTNLRKFLGLTPNLTWLRLNDVGSDEPAATRLLFWLALDPDKPFGSADEAGWSDINPKPVSLPLQRLDLGRMTVDSNTLSLIVQKFDKLESLSLRNINLHEPNYIQQGITACDDNHGASTWTTFFRRLPAIAPNLKHLYLRDLLQQKRLGEGGVSIIFETPVIGTNISHTFALKELYFTDKALLETLADRTWTGHAWSVAHQHESSLDSHEYGEASDSDSLDDLVGNASEDDSD